MLDRVLRLILAAAFIVSASAYAYAQGGATSSISGIVKDTAGGVVPGATVVVKNNATTTTFDTSTNAEGLFSMPAMDPGVYTVTVSLAGFKTSVISDVRVAPGLPATVSSVLEVGNLEESVLVQSSSEIINTQTATISSTLNVDQITRMPMTTRNVLNAVTMLPGVNTPGVNRDATVNGLPQSFINITLDGVSNNDNFNKTTDGFFASVTPRQDAIEAVTVTMGVGGADVGGHGAIAINMVTRSGSNRFTGSAYEYVRHPRLNTNTWFNIRDNQPKNDIRLNQYGARQGGPIVLPGLYDGRGKAFFFANYEELRLPNNFSRTRGILHPRAQQGWFRYTVAGGVREVNVLELARANGFTSTPDPTIAKILGLIEAGKSTSGVTINNTSDPMVDDFVWQSEGNQWERQPTIRIDYNIGARHRLSGAYSQGWYERDPDHLNSADKRFPNSVNYRKFNSTRPSRSITLRSTLSNNLVSELRGGITRGGASYFGQMATNGPQSFEDTGGFAITFDPDENILQDNHNWHTSNSPSWRASYQYTLDETLNWQRGRHSVTAGGGIFLGRTWASSQQMVPGINLGFNTTQDPAQAIFVTGNFAGASGGQLTDARQLYAILTGRVTSVTGQAALNPATGRYEAFAELRREGKMDEYSAFVQDSWRLTPTLTLNAGVRWDVQMPFSPGNDIMSTVTMADVCGVSGLGQGGTYSKCNFYAPGSTGGKTVPEFQLLKKGNLGYNTDWNNFAPNVGVAWRPNVQNGWLRTLLGDPEQATLRGGYSVAYDRQGLGEFTSQFGANPGGSLSLTRNLSTGLGTGADAPWPVLLRETNRLYNQPFPETPTFPIAARPNRADSIQAFAPDIVIASARSWTVGFQRSLSRDTAMEVRYVGTRGVNQWSELNYNERNLIENGFFDEFKKAMANLQANNAAGGSRAGSFAYAGPGTGTNPLPIYLAYLNGRTDATNAAAYTGGSNTWTNSTLAGRLVRTNPSPANAAGDLDGTLARRQSAAAAGLPANFFVVNPAIGTNNVIDSGAFSDYHAMQFEVRRRLSRGLQVNGSYQYAHESGSAFDGFRYGREMAATTDTLRHAIKTQWDWTIPVGRGQRFGSDMHPLLNAVIGGWQFNGVSRTQARMVNFGNVRLVGMTLKDVQKLYKHDIRINPDTGLRTVYTMPDDIILNTRRAFSTSTTSASGYNEAGLGIPEGRYFAPANSPDCIQLKTGDCAPRRAMVLTPWFSRFDIGVAKKFPLRGQVNFELKADVLNVFNNINFNQSASPGTGATIFQVSSSYSDINNTFDPGSRLGQISFRLNW